MTSEVRGYLLGERLLGEGLEINGGISPCGQATQSSEHECATVGFLSCSASTINLCIKNPAGFHVTIKIKPLTSSGDTQAINFLTLNKVK